MYARTNDGLEKLLMQVYPELASSGEEKPSQKVEKMEEMFKGDLKTDEGVKEIGYRLDVVEGFEQLFVPLWKRIVGM